MSQKAIQWIIKMKNSEIRRKELEWEKKEAFYKSLIKSLTIKNKK